MKTIKQYNTNELLALIQDHNRLVKDNYKMNDDDTSAMFGLIAEANDDNDLTLPYFEISSNETLSGSAYIFDLDWDEMPSNNQRFFVSISHEGGFFFADENNESCDGSQDYIINNLETAKEVYNQNNYGEVRLCKYDLDVSDPDSDEDAYSLILSKGV